VLQRKAASADKSFFKNFQDFQTLGLSLSILGYFYLSYGTAAERFASQLATKTTKPNFG